MERKSEDAARDREQLPDEIYEQIVDTDDRITVGSLANQVALEAEFVGKQLRSLVETGLFTIRSEGDDVADWEIDASNVTVQKEANSWLLKDENTSIVTRAGTATEALAQLTDHRVRYENGQPVGAQIVGINEAVISPEAAKNVDEIRTSYVEPSNKYLYAYLEEDGVMELTRPADLCREQRVLGFSIAGQFTREEFDNTREVPIDDLIAETPVSEAHFPLSMYKLMAVHPDHQEEGVGKALSAHGMDELAQHPPVVVMLWVRENEGNQKLAEEWGFEHLARFDTSPSTWECPECGFGTACTCGSVFYGRGFE